jgi:SNF2 family DNA or RNA helicase
MAKWLRPYQRADVKFMATTNCLNLCEPRLGKTTETIGAIFEAGLENGPHLVVSPSKTSLDSIWRYEVERWTNHHVITWSGELSTSERAAAIYQADMWLENDEPFWFVTTPDMIRRGTEILEMVKEWNSFTIDEFHKTGLPEIKNVFPKKANALNSKRRYALSGTPMGGKVIKLWGRLALPGASTVHVEVGLGRNWLEVTKTYGDHKEIGGIRPGLEDDFYRALSVHAVRRLRTEVLPQLPEKQWIDVWYDMTPKQRKQYQQFADNAEVRIDEYHLSATSVLAEYTRLKQFANSYCEVYDYQEDEDTGQVKMKLRATTEAGFLPHLMDRLAEVGIDPEEPAGTAQAIVTSQFRETADMVYDYLTEKGIKCGKITGKVNKKERDRLQALFKTGNDSEGYRVMVMTTTAGGVAITLDNCESVHILDETWNPDDQEQVSDRAINTVTNKQVNVFVYRSRDSIEDYIKRINDEKWDVNKSILDLRRQGLRANLKEAA